LIQFSKLSRDEIISSVFQLNLFKVESVSQVIQNNIRSIYYCI